MLKMRRTGRIADSGAKTIVAGALWLTFFLLLTVLRQGVWAHETHAHEGHSTQQQAEQINLVELDVPDRMLIDQYDKRGKLVSDFIGDRVVAFTFVYTTCTTICPILDGIFKKLQTRLGDDLGKDYLLLTLTIDSVIDVPARIKEHTKKLGVDNGWHFLTGDPETVKSILKGLEVYTADIANHPPTVFIVDGLHDKWYRLNGFPKPQLIEQAMREQIAAR